MFYYPIISFVFSCNTPYHQHYPDNHESQAPQQAAHDVEPQERTDLGAYRGGQLLGGIAGELSAIEIMLKNRIFGDQPINHLFGFLPGNLLGWREIGVNQLLDLRLVIRTDMDNLDGTNNHRALERDQQEEEKSDHVALGSKRGVPVPPTDEKEKQRQANGGD